MTVIRLMLPLVQGAPYTVKWKQDGIVAKIDVLISQLFFFLCIVFKVTSIVSSTLFLNQGHFVLKLAIATLSQNQNTQNSKPQ